MYHVTWCIGQLCPSQPIGLFGVCALFCCWVSLCIPLLISWYSAISSRWLGFLCPFYSFWPTHLGFLKLGSSGSATTHLPGCFCPWTFSLNIGLNMSPSDSFMSCLDSLLGYPTGGVPAVVTDCPCDVWCHGLTTCFLCVGPFFWKCSWKW